MYNKKYIVQMSIEWLANHILNILTAIIVAIGSYFYPAIDVFTLVFFAILFDLITAVMVAYKRGVNIESRKLWKTIKKLFLSLGLIALLYATDKELDIIPLYKVVSFFIVGFEIWSILENVAFITENPLFLKLREFMNDKFEARTGISMEDEDKTKD